MQQNSVSYENVQYQHLVATDPQGSNCWGHSPLGLIAFECDWRRGQAQEHRSEEYVEDCSPSEIMIIIGWVSVNVVESGEEDRSFSGRPEVDKEAGEVK